VAEVAEFFQSLGRGEPVLRLCTSFSKSDSRLLGEASCRSLSILDVGAGDGSLGNAVRDWAATRGWNWRVVNLDTSLSALTSMQTGLMWPVRPCTCRLVRQF
jgi:hypothetical protein